MKQKVYLRVLLLCSHSPNDVPPVPQRNVSIAAERGAVRPSIDLRVMNDIPFMIHTDMGQFMVFIRM